MGPIGKQAQTPAYGASEYDNHDEDPMVLYDGINLDVGNSHGFPGGKDEEEDERSEVQETRDIHDVEVLVVHEVQ